MLDQPTTEHDISNQPMKILVVDDTDVNVSLIQRFINKLGHKSIVAVNGIEAVEQFKNEQPDMVLMDVMMPEMDGYEATERIRELCGDQWVPIIFMSAKVSLDDQIKGFDVGGDDYLTKPINMRILEAKIKAMQRIAEMQHILEKNAEELKVYHHEAEDEKKLANELMESMTRSDAMADDLLETWVFPAEHMSGDLVAACRTSDDRLCFMAADATGHGLPAALLQLPVSQVFYQMASAGYSVSSIVTAMNKQLRELLPRDRFVAATVVSIDTRNQVIEIWNGGNPEAIFIGKDGEILHRFEPNAAPLGVLDIDEFASHTEMYKWDTSGELLAYSDGVLDADDPDGQSFGEDNLHKAISAKGVQTVFTSVSEALKKHLAGRRGLDDISIVSVRCDANTS